MTVQQTHNCAKLGIKYGEFLTYDFNKVIFHQKLLKVLDKEKKKNYLSYKLIYFLTFLHHKRALGQWIPCYLILFFLSV